VLGVIVTLWAGAAVVVVVAGAAVVGTVVVAVLVLLLQAVRSSSAAATTPAARVADLIMHFPLCLATNVSLLSLRAGSSSRVWYRLASRMLLL
jgi:hypothetical protein